MTVLASTDFDDPTPALAVRPVLEVVHDHDWRIVQVDWNDGVCVREYACAGCPDVWFA